MSRTNGSHLAKSLGQRILRSAVTLLLIGLAPVLLADAPNWSGTWNTMWRGDGAQMVLEQDGDTVSGYYEPYGGKILATANGQQLRGTWTQADGRGEFVFTMAPDRQTFMGRYDTGEWWNGGRVSNASGVIFQHANLDTPRDSLKSFLIAFNQIEYGEYQFGRMALETLDFSLHDNPHPKTQMLLAEQLFATVAQCTTRIWDLPGDISASSTEVEINQLGTGLSMTLNFVRNSGGDWKIRVPEELQLRNLLKDFYAARGIEGIPPNAHLELSNPRDTMRTFIEQIYRWHDGGKVHVMRSMDLSRINEAIRDDEAAIRAEYLKHILDRVGFVVWQEIPDNDGSQLPYVHFEHPLGQIVIAPVTESIEGTDTTRRVWKFTEQTVADIKELHTAFEDMPLVEGLSSDTQLQFFFQIRDSVRQQPWLLSKVFGVELWQWLGVLFSLVIGYLVGLMVAKFVIGVVRQIRLWFGVEPGKGKVVEFYHPLMITVMALVWKYSLGLLGLPDTLFIVESILTSLAVTLGLLWIAFRLTDWISGHLQQRVREHQAKFDDILVSLVSGLMKVVLVTAGVIIVADILTLPYESVLAGIGIGGLALAFAARETIADFFGSAVLLTDRPFRRGDRVNIGNVQGYVDYVGLRSTQIRTLDDSIMTIPNSRLAHEMIDNLKRRNARHFKTRISLVYGTPPERLEAFAEAVKATVLKQPRGLEKELHCGVWEFGPSSIELQLFCYLQVSNRYEEYDARNKLMTDIIRLAEEMNITFAFPTQTLYLASDASKELPGNQPV